MFTFPLAFIALLAVPALIAIYWLRNRFRRYTVSSLMLWTDQKQTREGGLRIQRMQRSLFFFLELLAILLFILAATRPMIRGGENTRPLVVVMDDSFSMLAGEIETPRDRAIKALSEEFRQGLYGPIYLVLAGEKPQVLDEPAKSQDQAVAQLKGWKCLSSNSNLEEALTFAFELEARMPGMTRMPYNKNRTRILVVSDHAPFLKHGVRNKEQEIDSQFLTPGSMLKWWAFGKALPNVALVNASRTSWEGRERGMLEIVNLSSQAAKTNLTLAGNPKPVFARQSVESSSRLEEIDLSSKKTVLNLGPHEVRRIFFELEPSESMDSVEASALHAQLDEDALTVDNTVILLRQAETPVRVEVRIQDDRLRSLIEKTIQASQKVSILSKIIDQESKPTPPTLHPQLIFTDQLEIDSIASETWVFQIIVEKDAEAYVGPFVMDRTHPLTEGISLYGVVWGSGRSERASRTSIVTPKHVITAGNIPLLTDFGLLADGGHKIQMQLRLDLSTLQNTPDWPILIWNLINWRANQVPGLKQSNVRLGTQGVLTVEPDIESAQVTDPDGNVQKVIVQSKTVVVKAERIGLYKIQVKENRYVFASNALSREESDLTTSASGRWGDWEDMNTLPLEYRNIAWIFILLAMGVLTIHGVLVARQGKSG